MLSGRDLRGCHQDLATGSIAQAIYRILDSPKLRAKLVVLGRNQSCKLSSQKTAEPSRRMYREAREIRSRR